MNFSFDILEQIAGGTNMFSAAELKLANYVLTNPEQVLNLSITELAGTCDVSIATVTRFCKRLSLNGYPELRMELAKAVTSTNRLPADLSAINPGDSQEVLIHKLFSIHDYTLTKATESLDPQSVAEAVRTMEQAKDVHFFGAGSMLLVAMIAQVQFMQVSTKFRFDLDIPIQALGASLMTSESAAVIFSYTGSTRDVVDVAALAKKNGAKIIAVTRYTHSPLADLADTVIICGVSEGPYQMGSMPVKTGMLFIIDVLCTEYCLRNPVNTQANKEKTSNAVIGKINPVQKG